LYQVERRIGVRWDYLQALEYGAFETIPLYEIRATMLKYCQFLNVDARTVFEQAQRSYLRQSRIQHFNHLVMMGLAAVIVVLALLPWMLGVF
jgi:cytoskeletal protein RodZ